MESPSLRPRTAGGRPSAPPALPGRRRRRCRRLAIGEDHAALYYLAARRLPGLWRRAWPFGEPYGVAVYLVMTQAVLPLSAAGAGSKHRLWVALSILVHMFWIGLPSALAARRLLRRG